MTSSVVIADDHPIVLQGLETLLRAKNYQVLARFYNGISCANYLLKNNPDLAILEINMPGLNGLEILSFCRKHRLRTKVIILTMSRSVSIYQEALRKGAMGYLIKNQRLDDILKCITVVLEGKVFIGAGLHHQLVEQQEERVMLEQFSPTEKRILRLIADNRTSKEIADLLFVSKRTVDAHRNNINHKIGLCTGGVFKLKDWIRQNQL